MWLHESTTCENCQASPDSALQETWPHWTYLSSADHSRQELAMVNETDIACPCRLQNSMHS